MASGSRVPGPTSETGKLFRRAVLLRDATERMSAGGRPASGRVPVPAFPRSR